MESDRAKELKESELWREFVVELEADIEKLKERLVFEQDREKIVGLQFSINSVRSVIKKPDEIVER